MAEEKSTTYTPSIYLSVTDDANRWRAGPPQVQQREQSKVNQLVSSGLGLSIEKRLSQYDVQVLAAETRKQAWLGVEIGPKTSFVVYVLRVCRLRDGATCVSSQRYRALRNFYADIVERGLVRTEDAPEFPGKQVVTEESFLGERADVNSEFVRQRKDKLASFLRQLFNKHPGRICVSFFVFFVFVLLLFLSFSL
ncbi:unnamed protein product [Choristocarpus tenellus]